jgi:zinc protease
MPPAASAGAGSLQVPKFEYKERVLANGLRVISSASSASPTVSVQVWYQVGSKDDPQGRSGFAHLFEHMMFKSTKYLKNEQFDRMTEDVGGANNAFTADDVTAYQNVVPSNHLERLLWAEAERMQNLAVDQANFDSERDVVKEEFRERVLARPYGRLYNAIDRLSYEVHPYKRPGIGNIAELDAATLDDVRAFHRTYYRPDNAVLIVTGDFQQAQLDAWVDKHFAGIARPQAPVPRVTVKEPLRITDKRFTETGPSVPLPAVVVTWHAPPVTSPDAAALKVAAALLSRGESSRFNQSLVYQQQIAAQADFYADLRNDTGLLVAMAVAAQGKRTADLEAAMLRQIRDLANRPASAAEMDKIKTQVITQALLDRQTPSGKAQELGAAISSGNTERVNTDLADLQRVTAADVQRVLRQYVLQARSVTIEYRQGDKPVTAESGARQ